MPYNAKYKPRTKSTRRAPKRYSKRGARGQIRRRKYTKVSRKRTSWQSATTVSPYRKFIYNDTGFEHVHTTIAFQFDNVFRGNSLFDPDYTGVGVQPYGFDQLCPVFYNNYFVKASKISIFPATIGNSSNAYFEVLVVPYRAATLPYTEVEDIRRMPYARSVRLHASTVSEKTDSVHSYATSRAILSKEFTDDALATGQYDGNPTITWFWHVISDSTTFPVGANTKVKFDVKIKYYTKLIRKQELNES